MLAYQLGHLEHVDYSFATENLLESFISDDIALLGWILEILALDVNPELLHNL